MIQDLKSIILNNFYCTNIALKNYLICKLKKSKEISVYRENCKCITIGIDNFNEILLLRDEPFLVDVKGELFTIDHISLEDWVYHIDNNDNF